MDAAAPPPLDEAAVDRIFRRARTHNAFHPRPIPDRLLRQVYELAKWGPTTANSCPMRVVFVISAAAKEKLRPALSEGNRAKTMAAPATAIVAYDSRFYELLPRLFPHNRDAINWFAGPAKAEATRIAAIRNSALQGAYLIIAARALGLDCGPMSGFDNDMVDAAFFADGRWKSNFLINLGWGVHEKLHPRLPRLEFDEVCRIE